MKSVKGERMNRYERILHIQKRIKLLLQMMEHVIIDYPDAVNELRSIVAEMEIAYGQE